MHRNCSLKPRLSRFADWWNSSTIHHSQSRYCSMLYYQRSDRAPINDQTRTHALLKTCIDPGQPRLEISHILIVSQDSFTLGHMNHQHCGMNVWRGTKSMDGRGEPTASYIWTGWVCDTVRLCKCYPYNKRYNSIYVKKFLLPCKNTIGKTSKCYSLRFKTKVTFGEISLSQTLSNELKCCHNQCKCCCWWTTKPNKSFTCLIIDIWTWRCRRTSTRFYALRCHLPKLASFQWNWRQKFSTLLWTPLARRKALNESCATHAVSCKKCKKWP